MADKNKVTSFASAFEKRHRKKTQSRKKKVLKKLKKVLQIKLKLFPLHPLLKRAQKETQSRKKKSFKKVEKSFAD